jgi:hypothetical protein
MYRNPLGHLGLSRDTFTFTLLGELNMCNMSIIQFRPCSKNIPLVLRNFVKIGKGQ